MPIRAIVADDSAFMRKVISDILGEDKEIQVVATCRDGREAVQKVLALRPDVLTLDVEMPNMNGLEALSEIMKKQPTATVMLSALTRENAEETIKALELGAVDFVQKPGGSISLDIGTLREEIIGKVKAAAQARLKKIPHAAETGREFNWRARNQLIVIGASTGGPQAIAEILPALPQDFPAAVLIVQHMPAGFTNSYAERLNRICRLPVREAADGDAVERGVVLLAPGDYHMQVSDSHVRLDRSEKVHNVRPAVDMTMRSAAEFYGKNTIGVLLTGMGSDGALGMKAIKKHGGRTIAQDESTSVIFGMPKAAIELGCVDKVLPLHLIAGEIIKMLEAAS